MGTMFTIDIRDPGTWDTAISDVVGWLHRVDRLFSTDRTDSDISRLRRREIRLDDADPLVTEVLGLCADAEVATGGHFSARDGGRLDPTGLVRAGRSMRPAGDSASTARPTTPSTAAVTSSWSVSPKSVACGRWA